MTARVRHRVLLIFALGVGTGVVLAWWLGQRPPAPRPPADTDSLVRSTDVGLAASSERMVREFSSPLNGRADMADSRQVTVAVRVMDSEGGELSVTEGILTGSRPVVVIPVVALRGAAAVVLRDLAGLEVGVRRVLAFDSDSGLAALDGRGLPSGLQLVQQDHPLYLGRELYLVSGTDRVRGWVDGAEIQDPDSPFPVVPVRIPGGAQRGSGALVDRASHRLLGLVMQPLGEKDLLGAVQAGAVRELLSRMRKDESISIPDLVDVYFQRTPQGMWAEIQHRRNVGDWRGAMGLAASLLSRDWRYHQRSVETVERALTALVNAALAAGQPTEALALLEDGERVLGENVILFTLYATAYLALGELDLARTYAQRAVLLDPARAPEAMPLLRRIVLNQLRSLDQENAVSRSVKVLEEAVAIDPGYAVHRRYLGHYYLRQGNYAAAIDQFTEALALDNSRAAELSALVADARIKLSLPELTEVPTHDGGGVFLVDVRVNDLQSFAFVLDTGASHTVISSSLVDVLGITVPPDGQHVLVQTANDAVRAPVVTLRSLTVGRARVENVRALVLDTLGTTKGLLGLTYLRHFDVSIEHQKRMLRLRRK